MIGDSKVSNTAIRRAAQCVLVTEQRVPVAGNEQTRTFNIDHSIPWELSLAG